MLITVNFDKNFEGKMEGYLNIFGRKFWAGKGISGYGEGSGNIGGNAI
jgi:hypothetical protein